MLSAPQPDLAAGSQRDTFGRVPGDALEFIDGH